MSAGCTSEPPPALSYQRRGPSLTKCPPFDRLPDGRAAGGWWPVAGGWWPPGQQRAAAQGASERVGRPSGVARLRAPPLQRRQLEQPPPAGAHARHGEKTPRGAHSCRGGEGGAAWLGERDASQLDPGEMEMGDAEGESDSVSYA